jgi:hypothetical protein
MVGGGGGVNALSQPDRLSASIKADLDRAVRALRDAQSRIQNGAKSQEVEDALHAYQLASGHLANLFAAVWENPNTRSALTGDFVEDARTQS